MSDKSLSVSEWKKFAKGLDLKDGALIKALEALDKGHRDKPDVQLKTLHELDKQLELLHRSAKGHQAVLDHLDDMSKALKVEHKALEQALKDQAREAAKVKEEDEDSPAILSKLLVPLLRQLRQGGVRMPVMVGLAGKETAVLISRKAISPSRRAVLAEALGASGSIKCLLGECLFEDGSYTFVMHTPSTGLAKRLQAALLHQTGLRLKVKVRGEDED